MPLSSVDCVVDLVILPGFAMLQASAKECRQDTVDKQFFSFESPTQTYFRGQRGALSQPIFLLVITRLLAVTVLISG